MAFPSVAASNTSSETSETTSHTVNLPASISSGDLLLMLFTCDSGNDDAGITTPTGWTIVVKIENDPGSIDQSTAVYYRAADGGEGSTISVTTSLSEKSAHQTHRITGHHTDAPEGTILADGTGSAIPNPPSITPSWGAEDTLFFAAMSKATGSDVSTDSYPSSYTDVTGTVVDSASGAAGASCAWAGRELNGSPEDPGTFGIGSSDANIAITIAVRTAGAGGLSIPIASYHYQQMAR